MANTKSRLRRPSVKYLHECFILRRDGTLIWKKRPLKHFSNGNINGKHSTRVHKWKVWNAKYNGKKAGYLDRRQAYGKPVRINNRLILMHLIVFAMTTGKWPREEIDHRDGNPANNHFSNLREASHAEGRQNNKLYKNNTSGFTGVGRYQKRWQAKIQSGGQQVFLGMFDTPEEAYVAYLAAKKIYHPFQPEPRFQWR